MAHRHVLFGNAAREKLLRGANALADAVRLTIGPKARCVLIQKKWGKPIVCDDGVTIAKEFELKDAEENLGAQVIREAAEKTGDAVGDGTSTATILAYAIYSEGLRNIAAGASAIDLKRGLDRGLRAAVESIKALSRPVSNRLERAQVATVSAHNDSVLGELVADAMEKVGGEGVVSVEEAKGTVISVEVVEGMQFDRAIVDRFLAEEAHIVVATHLARSREQKCRNVQLRARHRAVADGHVQGFGINTCVGARRQKGHKRTVRGALQLRSHASPIDTFLSPAPVSFSRDTAWFLDNEIAM